MVGEDCLYYDTDSCIYVARPGIAEPPLGDYLGQLTSELDPGQYITEYVASGPKSYAYRQENGKEVCKVRGFQLNFENSQLINFDAIKDMVIQGSRDTITVTNPSKICRDPQKAVIYNRVEEKNFRMVYTKRHITEDLNTLPYGY